MNNSIDQQFVEFVVKSLVGNPDAVQVERRIDEKGVLLELTVDPEDLGRVIGKRGATAQSLRTLLRALGTKNEARYNLKIIDNGVGGGSTDDSAVADTPVTTTPVDGDTDVAVVVEETVTTDAPSDLSDLTDDDEVTVDRPASQDDDDRMARHRRELAEFDDLDV
ncbi:MAG: RNA-binding protein [Candidatus Saccharibacteria bacterium]|nr:RNA-binding protein [Candidatus Saccharibacteria bacterium]